MHRINLSNYQIHTDLIIDNSDLTHEEKTIDDLTITRTKDKGNYITLSFKDITNFEDREKVGHYLELILLIKMEMYFIIYLSIIRIFVKKIRRKY